MTITNINDEVWKYLSYTEVLLNYFLKYLMNYIILSKI